ncbi:alpha/beta fold hydrolase [Streptomyces pacificus]|uniref:Alpha/beta hydrolase n=1 Tax=Streptomyces pacificus TaxID=2705029 RepID=A0A6A0AU82_9ACTN|nr:alpha/beta fold hydrolase [Streptomyces pacificus]GFH35167.1 alpha/beta hydrolase [Streptomyces pacificus]
MRKEYADTPQGRLHYARDGEGPPVVLTHQTPRSADEYADVLPLLAAGGFTAIAPDTLGYGESEPPRGAPTIETYATALLALLDVLELPAAVVGGHHTGGVIAFEAAVAAPHRVASLVLSCTPYLDEKGRAALRAQTPTEDQPPRIDAGHLLDLWRQRAAFYPPDRPELLDRFLRDALRAWRPQAGHTAVGSYRMEDRIDRLAVPTLLLGADADPVSYPDLDRWRQVLPDGRIAVIVGAGVPAPEHMPREFADAIIDFLRTHHPLAGAGGS